MKEIVKTSRLAGSLEKLFHKINLDFFDGALETPIITIQSTPRAYGHYSVMPIWTSKEERKHEINIGAGTLDRPIEQVVATMLHEAVHHYCGTVLHEQDTSNRGIYHNKIFKREAEARLLICTRSEKYGYSDTSSQISDELIEWILKNNIQEIKLNRNEFPFFPIKGGSSSNSSGNPSKPISKSNSRKYVCPNCGLIVRATRIVRVACMDCSQQLVIAN